MPSIVQITVSQSVAPAPNNLQKRGAFISQGGTTLAAGSYALLNTSSSLSAILAAPLALASLTWSGGTVVATTSAAIPGATVGDPFAVSITGVSPAAFNGTFVGTVTGANTFTYALAANPGTATVPGSYSPPNQGELVIMNDSFWAQGTNASVYVLELGPADQTTAPALLGTWITANPQFFYSYLVPRGWDASTEFLALIAQSQNLNAKQYFFTTTKLSTYASYSPTMKNVQLWLQAPGTDLLEYDAAAAFQIALGYTPSSTNRMTPFAFSYMFGVTQYPTTGNSALLATLQAANVNVVGSGAEGGISNNIVLWGTNCDGNDFTYWYSVDWIQINCDLAISNAIINGSNNPLNPLYYDQNGINRLQDVVVQTVGSAISFGLATGTVQRAALDGPVFTQNLDNDVYEDQDVVNAVPFTLYTQENPSAFQQGSYGGLSVVYIPNRGFKQILFSIQVTSFITQ